MMLQELQSVHKAFTKVMKAEQGVLGAWYFGSTSHGTTDEHSDIDIVFLVEGHSFTNVDEKLNSMLGSVCDEIVVCWPEEFNSDAIKNYCYVLRVKERLFQYDVFLLNKDKLDDYMCRIHYTELKLQEVVFDKDGSVQALIEGGNPGQLWKDDLSRLVRTYWLHIEMSAKYFVRKDFFKLNQVLRILMDTHTSLLLTAYDVISWGGSANKLHFLEDNKQEHLMKYACTEDFVWVRNNLAQAMNWFEEDLREILKPDEMILEQRAIELIKQDWLTKTKQLGH